MADGGAGSQPPREPPRSLQGLLQMAVTAGTAEPSQRAPMSHEVRDQTGGAWVLSQLWRGGDPGRVGWKSKELGARMPGFSPAQGGKVG